METDLHEKESDISSKNVTIEIDCWKGDWGLPSVDFKCLNVLAYAKFSGVSLKVHKNRILFKNLAARFPAFHASGEILHSDTKIIQYLCRHHLDLDADLTDQQRADVLAFKTLLEEKYLPALLHVLWIDAKNYVELTRPWYAKVLCFPLNYFIPGQMQRMAEGRVELTRGGDHMEPQELTSKVYEDAKKCINLLSHRLGRDEFFFGQVPSSLDALVFSYLAPLLRAPLPSDLLQKHLKATDNLCKFCSRILQRYFPDEPIDNNKPSKTPAEEPFDDPYKIHHQVLAAAFALTAMVSYAFLSGLIRLRVTDADQAGIELDYDDEEDQN